MITEGTEKQKRRSRFDSRLEKYYDELKGLYLWLYQDEEAFEYFLKMLKKSYRERSHKAPFFLLNPNYYTVTSTF